jgi:hypothetical protein
MIREMEMGKRKEVVLLSKLSQEHIESAVFYYPYDHFHARNIRVQLKKMYDLVIDEGSDPDRILGRRIGEVLSAMEENGYLRVFRIGSSNHGIIYEKNRSHHILEKYNFSD